jgi:hypothetical protein
MQDLRTRYGAPKDYVDLRRADVKSAKKSGRDEADLFPSGAIFKRSSEAGSSRPHEPRHERDFEEGSIAKRAYDAGFNAGVWNMLFSGIPTGEPYSALDKSTWSMPEAVGRFGSNSRTLQDTIMHFTIAQEELGLWKKLIPIVEFSADEFPLAVWTTVEYLPTYAPDMPPMGQPTYVRSRRTSDKAVLTRHGIGASVDSAYLNTAKGTKHWMYTLNQVAGGIVSTSQLGGAIAITRAEDTYIRSLEVKGKLEPPFIDGEFNYIARTFGAMQMPGTSSFTSLRSIMEERYMHRHNDTSLPRAMIVSNNTMDALMHNNPKATDYSRLGPTGPENLKRQSTIGLFEYLNSPVFALRPFLLASQDIFQPMANPIEVGEYYRMFNRIGMIKPGEKYSSIMRAIQVYTHTKRWTTYTLSDALKHCFTWVGDGKPEVKADHMRNHAFANTSHNGVANTLGQTWWWAKFAESATAKIMFKAADGVDPLEEARVLPINLAAMEKHVNADKPLPLNFILAWPHIRFMADDAVLAPPGEFAKRMVQPVLVSIADNIDSRTHEIIAEFNSGCAIVNPKLAITARAVHLREYLGGLGHEPITLDGRYNPQQWQLHGDFVAIVLPGHWDQTPENLNLAGRIVGCLEKRFSDQSDRHGENPNWYPGCEYYDDLYGWTSTQNVHIRGSRELPQSDINVISYDIPVNIMCRPGTQRIYDSATASFGLIDYGNGYFKQGMTYVGCEVQRSVGGVYAERYPEQNLKPI